MTTIEIDIGCPNCGEEIEDITGDSETSVQRVPYGSTSALEVDSSLEWEMAVTCDKCGYEFTGKEVQQVHEKLSEAAYEREIEAREARR